MFSSVQAQESSQDVPENSEPHIAVDEEEVLDRRVPVLLWMVQYGKLEDIQPLLDMEIDPNAEFNGSTALILAVERHNIAIIRALLVAGADPNLKNGRGQVALIQAIDTSYIETGHLVDSAAFKAGIKIRYNWRQNEDNVSDEQNYAIIELLVEAGADLDVTDRYDYTPLMSAAINGDERVLRLLLDHGAKIGYVNGNGYTAWHVARFNNHVTAARMIQQGSTEEK